MSENINLVGNQFFSSLFDESVRKAQSGSGSIILLTGESGFGKTHILNHYLELYKTGAKGIRAVFTEGQAPIGKFNVGNIQPLFPFSKAFEHLLESNIATPEKRFAKNVGLTLLASIPLIDTVFYAVKEIGRDWRQFKTEKSSEKAKKVSTATADYYDSLQAFADKMPFVILMDDMHWADAQSVELLTLVAENLKDLPIVFVVSYKRSMLDLHGLPLSTFLMNFSKNKGITVVELDSFSKEQIGELAATYFKNYKHVPEFEEWIHEHSYGVPGVAAEYLKYFQKYPPFDENGSLVMNFAGNEYLPSTVQSVFSQHLETLSDEERNLLAICSAEGREFTALVVSQLMNVDVLTAIRKLKQLQSKTGIIKSIGPEHRYGVKTTVFKFNQAFYHTYFENSLEYEEYTSLHGQIAAFLKSKYEQTENEALREDIAPYLAAHSMESGDEDTAKSMLLETAKNAQKYGNTEIVKSAYEQYKNLNLKTQDKDSNLNNLEFIQMIGSLSVKNPVDIQNDLNTGTANSDSSAFDESFLDFKIYIKSIINDMLSFKYESAIDKIEVVLTRINQELTVTEMVQILCLQIKCYTELHNLSKVEEILSRIDKLIKSNNNNFQAESLYYNIAAGFYSTSGNMPKAYYFLDKSANLSSKLPQELRLLTLANIGIITKHSTPEKAAEYIIAARKLSKALNYEKLAEELV